MEYWEGILASNLIKKAKNTDRVIRITSAARKNIKRVFVFFLIKDIYLSFLRQNQFLFLLNY